MERHAFPRGRALVLLVALAAAGLAGIGRAQDDEPAPPPPAAIPTTPEPPPEPPGVGDALPARLPVLRAGAGADATPGVLVGDVTDDPTRPTVIVFWSVRCPVCKRYRKVLAGLAGAWRDTVNVLIVVSGSDQTTADVKAALGTTLRATVLLDPDAAAAALFGVRVTPTALVVDAANVIRYVGPIDDDRRARGRDSRALLRPAVEAVLAGKAPETAEARPFGSAVR